MKRPAASLLVILGLTLPCFFLAMYMDYQGKANLLHYLAIFLLHAILCLWGIKIGSRKAVIIGNLIGLATNYSLWLIPHPEKWRYYFKCSPSSDFLFMLLGISCALQACFLVNDWAKQHWK